MRQWSSGIIHNYGASPSLSPGAAIARWFAPLLMKRESLACVPLCRLFARLAVSFPVNRMVYVSPTNPM